MIFASTHKKVNITKPVQVVTQISQAEYVKLIIRFIVRFSVDVVALYCFAKYLGLDAPLLTILEFRVLWLFIQTRGSSKLLSVILSRRKAS